MKKKALFKDFYMEIRTSLNRFLSIFFIVALGVAFFSGIRASEPDMRYSGDAYFDRHAMMDLKVLSTLGLTEDDIEAIRHVDGVEKVEAGYMVDTLSVLGENEHVIHIESLPRTMNQVDVFEGRLPEKAGECVVDVDRAEAYGIKVGDSLTLKSGNDKELSDTLNSDTYTVVGTCSSPVYISFERGSTNIGSGEVDMFAYVTDESFCQEVYSQAWVMVAGAKSETAFTEGYTERIDAVKEGIEAIADERCEIRYAEIKDEADEKISEAESELESAKTEAESELNEAEQELKDGEEALADGKEALVEAEQKLADAREMLFSSRDTLDSGWAAYFIGLAQFEDGKVKLAEAEQKIADSEAVLTAGEAQLAEGGAQLEAQESELSQAEAAIAAGKAQFGSVESGRQQYQGLMSGFETMNNKLKFLQSKIDAGTASAEEIAQAEALGAQIAEMDGQLKQMDTVLKLMERESEISENRAMLETAKSSLEVQKAELAGYRTSLEAGKAELEAQKQTLPAAEEALVSAYGQLNSGETAYLSGEAQITDGEAQIADSYRIIAENEQKLADGWTEYEKGKKEAEEKISDAEIKILDARNEIESIDKPTWYVNDRDSYSDYSGYSDNADRMRAIGEVFPILFFLVAALVSLTTMTRMVEEQRTQIGTLKALGYSKFWIAAKYMGYALAATLGGAFIGVLAGQKIFPFIIVTAYKIMYAHIPDVVIPYHIGYSLAATLAALACTMLATISACYRELGAQPAELMRPEAPKAGKRVFLEQIPFIWRNLSFTWKSTVRNLMRYKKRFFMTVFGIGGCMALMLVGYGLKDSIMDIAVYQYGRIQVYDMMAVLDENVAGNEKEKIDEGLSKDSRIEAYMDGYMKKVDVKKDSESMDLYLYVPSQLEHLDNFIRFSYRTSGETYSMDENSAILTEKAAKEMGVSKGDEIEVKLDDSRTIKVTITDICENYLYHYLYIAPQLYESITGDTDYFNCIFADVKEESMDELNRVGEELLKNESILSVSYTNNMEERLEDMLSTLDDVIIVLIISAGMLAFVVLYNLNNININERKRELATLKVLGFYDGEVAAYVFRENILLTIIGAAAGVILGKILHLFVVQTVEVDMTMFGRNINLSSFVYSVAFTLLFSLLVNAVMYFKLRKIDMVESMKSVE